MPWLVRVTALVWALTAAVLYGIGAALQQRQAAATPSQAAARPRLLLLLVRRPWWLLGIGVELSGFATHAVALRTGPLTIVQMLVASSLLFSVATVRLWSGRRLSWTAWAGVLAVIAGIALFVALASPAGGDPGVPGHAGLAAACLAACAVPLAAAGLAAAGRLRAVLLAVAAGLADAGIAVVTMAFSHVVSGGLTGMAGSWATYALMLGGPCSLLLTQTAYQAGRPMITLPVIAVVTPVASLAAGNLLLGESARLGVLGGAAAALAVLVTSAGLVVLARLATEQPGPVGASTRPWCASESSAARAPGQVGHQAPQVAARPCAQRHGEPFVQLLVAEPALGKVVAEAGRGPFPVSVRGPDLVSRWRGGGGAGGARSEQPVGGVQPPDHGVQPEQLGVAGEGATRSLPGGVLPGPGSPLHQLDEVPPVRLDHLVHVGAGHLPGQLDLQHQLIAGLGIGRRRRAQPSGELPLPRGGDPELLLRSLRPGRAGGFDQPGPLEPGQGRRHLPGVRRMQSAGPGRELLAEPEA